MPTELSTSPSSRSSSTATAPARASVGIPGLDQILRGGLPANHIYLVDGTPGTGKTTLALQFLIAGASRGERGVYVTLSESEAELREVATSHGWSLDGIVVVEVSEELGFAVSEPYTIFHPAEVELQQTTQAVLAAIEEHDPALVVFDSLSEMRLLAREPLRFRRQILALKHYFAGRQCTVLLLDDKSAQDGDLQLHSLAHGVIVLEHLALEYGSERRRLQVTKLRGLRFAGGYHDFRIRQGGLDVYPRIDIKVDQPRSERRSLPSGSAELDLLVGGGLDEGTSLLITGAAGTGKSVLATQYACAAAARGERVQFYLFDERLSTFHLRSDSLRIDTQGHIADQRLVLQQIEPTQMSPGEFASHVVRAVEDDGIRMLVIDSINGYMQSMPEERLLAAQVHELLSYLANHRVTSIMTLVQRGIFGSPVDDAAEVSHIADTVILLRYFEVHGHVRQAISVVKRRSGNHERAIRECRVGMGGMTVGAPLHEFQGVLTGVPSYIGQAGPLLRPDGVHAPVPPSDEGA